MRRTKKRWGLCFLFVLSVSALGAFSQEDLPGAIEDKEGGIIYGDDHAFAFAAAKGWVLDNQTGVGMGLHAVFYPEGSTWADAPSVMYINTKRKTEGLTFKEAIKNETEDFKHRSAKPSDFQSEERPSIKTQDGRDAAVRYFHYWGDQKNENFESVAYIDIPNVIAIVVLTSPTKGAYDSSIGAFEELVKSFTFLTSNVVIKEKEQESKPNSTKEIAKP